MVPPAARTSTCLQTQEPGAPLLDLVSDSTCDAIAATSKWLDRDPTGLTPTFQEQFQQQKRLAWPPREDAAGGMSPSMGMEGANSNGGWLMGPGSLASSAEEEGARLVARLRADMRALDEVGTQGHHSFCLLLSTNKVRSQTTN